AARRAGGGGRRARPPRAGWAGRGGDRGRGPAAERAPRAERVLRALDEPLPLLAPLAEGDPVEARELGVRGTIASIEGDEAEVLVQGGARVRLPLARLLPSAEARTETEPAVKVVAAARGDVSDQLDVRGMRADEARDAVRTFVDDAALAGLAEVTVVHGRGTGALRTAVRAELTEHPLVGSQSGASADGATIAELG